MKAAFKIYTFIFLVFLTEIYSQTFFQKVTTGPIATENSHGVNSAWGDYDNDGYLDLVVGQGTEGVPYPVLLYHNNGNGTFTKITNNIISQTYGVIVGVCWGDYDNDGKLDLFLGNRGYTNILFHNDGNGNFTRIFSGIQVNEVAKSTSASWCDYDRDGFLDIFVANSNFIKNFLYHNNGDGTFTKVTAGVIATDSYWCRGAAWGDYDNDGWPDLFVVADQNDNDLLYHNNGNGSFSRIFTGALVNDGLWGVQCAWGDYNNDGLLDIAVTLEHGINRVYKNDGNGQFTNMLILPSFTTYNYYGISWGDYNNDTYLDLHIGTYPVNCSFLKNVSGTSFVNAANEIPSNEVGTDGAWADYNNDGKLDLFVSYSPNQKLYLNIGSTGNFIICKLKGCLSNSSAIGARVTLYSGTLKLIREVSSGDGNENMLWQHFGLGSKTIIDSIVVLWPYGQTERKQVVRNAVVNTSITIDECLIGIEKISSEIPEHFSLSQNYPNPFNPTTTIKFALPTSHKGVRLVIYDILGKEVTTLVNEQLQPGEYSVTWDASDYPSGIYFYTIIAGDYIESKKIILIK